MLRVPIEQATAGMVLAQATVSPDQLDHVLLKRDFTLDAESIGQLRKLKVRTIWVHYPSMDFMDDMLDPALLESKQEVYRSLKKGFSEAVEGGIAKIRYVEYIRQMTAMFTKMLSDSSRVSPFLTELQGRSDDVFSHGISVASLAMMVGMRLEGYLLKQRPNVPSHLATDLAQLGVGCVLHDIGKLALPDELRGFHLTGEDFGTAEWQGHTEAGMELLKAGVDGTAVQVVLNHHQHYDGSGFPLRKAEAIGGEVTLALSGDDIHIFCRIAALADRFDSFRYMPDGRVAPPVVALKRLQNPAYQKWFDPRVYETFFQVVPAFSPGDLITLNNGQLAAVVAINESLPCRPLVQPVDPARAIGRHSGVSEGEVEQIDLAMRNELEISRVGDFDVTRFLY
jgi:HD-GYP domain-containing protein (c-di-GMP phosphodiesterase class II)